MRGCRLCTCFSLSIMVAASFVTSASAGPPKQRTCFFTKGGLVRVGQSFDGAPCKAVTYTLNNVKHTTTTCSCSATTCWRPWGASYVTATCTPNELIKAPIKAPNSQ